MFQRCIPLDLPEAQRDWYTVYWLSIAVHITVVPTLLFAASTHFIIFMALLWAEACALSITYISRRQKDNTNNYDPVERQGALELDVDLDTL